MSKVLLAAMDRLVDVLDRENAALLAMDVRRAVALLPEKTGALADLATRGPKGSAESGADLVAVSARLNGLARENRRLLERAMTAQQRVIGIVAAAVASATVAPSYRASGQMTGRSGPMALSTRV